MPRVLIAALLLVAGCEDPPVAPASYPFTFTAHADGRPLATVEILVDGRPIGVTASDGVLRTSLTGPEGAAIAVSARCPDGYRSPIEPQSQTLSRLASIDPSAALRGIELSFACPPMLRRAVVLVRTHDQAGLPVVLDGREVTRTDESGAAHVLLAMAPGASFQVLLDTRNAPRLLPPSPSMSFTVADRDEVFVFDRPFELTPEPRRVRQPPRTGGQLPVRIEGERR